MEIEKKPFIESFKDECYKIYNRFKWIVLKIRNVPIYHITSSNKEGYTWFRIAKNGTRSILAILEEHTSPDINGARIPYFKKDFSNHYKFTIIRNPFDRLVSCYCNKVERKMLYEECWDKDFEFFVHYVEKLNLKKCDQHLKLQTAMFPIYDMDYIGKFENFEYEFNFIINNKLGLGQEPIQKNISKHRHYSEYYTEELIKIVAELYKDDIEYGNYEFEYE